MNSIDKKYIIELVEDCDLVFERTEECGHDCWGKREYSTSKYVRINGKLERCFKGWYVVHDGKKVHDLLIDFLVTDEMKKEIEERKVLKSRVKKINKIKSKICSKSEI